MQKKSNLGLKLSAVLIVFGPLAAWADPPIDLTTAGTTIAGYVPAAAASGVLIMIAIVGVRVIKGAFRTAAK